MYFFIYGSPEVSGPLQCVVHESRDSYTIHCNKAEEIVFRKESSSETGSILCKCKRAYFSKYKTHFQKLSIVLITILEKETRNLWRNIWSNSEEHYDAERVEQEVGDDLKGKMKKKNNKMREKSPAHELGNRTIEKN